MNLLNLDWRWWILAVMVLAVLLVFAAGCDYAFIHKKHITEFHTLFQAYRTFVEVKPEFNAELVNKGADDLERTLRAWKGDWKDVDD